jgi:two-component system, OmpR family, sensor histidine kinase BaeS
MWQGSGFRGGRRRFMRRIALFVGFVFLLLFAATTVTVALATTAVGNATGWVRLAAALSGFLVFVVGLWLVGRSVRRMFGPIGDVMEAADRVADGDYSVRVRERGPGEVRRLGRTFNDMTERLQESDEQRRRLLADVTHELRTPLSVVQGNLEGVADGIYEADEERVAAVLEQTRLMGRLLDDLQTLSTAEAGALSLTVEPTDLAAVIEQVAAAFAPHAAAGEIELTTSLDSSPELSVDPARIRQVLENVVANAVRHTPAGGTVKISLMRREDVAELSVSDTGPGIAAEEIDSIFDRYARSADSGGSGLGLAIARNLVEAHGGSIEAESPPGGGATILVRLPVRD